MKKLNLKNSLLISFVVVFIFLFFFLGYNKLISTGPMSIHSWRQSDSYSFAITYFNENNKLLEPSILFTGEGRHGKAISEFPIIYFITAKIWKITGVTPAVLKFINFLILLCGLFHLAKLSNKLLRDNFWSMVVVLTLFSSPLLGYYGFNFIPNIPAFGLALTGIYYFFEFVNSEKTKDLILFTCLFAIASLIKVTALITLFGALFVAFTYYLTKIRSKHQTILKIGMSSIFILFTYWRWYIFSTNYNKKNLQGIFNQSTLPIWKLNKEAILDTLDKFYFNVFPQYFNDYFMYAFLLLLVFIIVNRKAMSVYARRASIIYFLGLISFMLLFFKGINVHDYFLTNTLILIPAIVLTFLLYLQKNHNRIFSSARAKFVGAILVAFLINYNMVVTRSHYNPKQNMVKYNIPLKSREVSFWGYNHYKLELFDLPYQGINKYLQKIGLTYDDKVITVGDTTPNKTLSIMNLRGFPEYHYLKNYDEKAKIERMIELGATHFVVSSNREAGEITRSYFGEKIGTYNNIDIYTIKNK